MSAFHKAAVYEKCRSGNLHGRSWPFFPVNEGLNGAEADFRFVLESGRSALRLKDRPHK